MESMATASRQREEWIDWLRVVACFMVMVVHSTEPFYLGGDGSLVLTRTDAFWSAFLDSFVRACVPLFLVASSYLQFPLHYSTGEFLRRRAVRILVPFAVWSVVYAFVWGEPVQNFKDLLLNFNYVAGHLWFVYMLVGVYLIMPLLSPWAEKVGKKELQVWLCIWLFTTLLPLIRDWASGGQSAMVYGPSGIPRGALYPLWGEASWNTYGTFYYVSGVAGYLLLGLYFRRFVGDLSWKRTLSVGLPCFLAGFALTFGGFFRRVLLSARGAFPVSGPVDLAVRWETTWNYDNLGIVLMTVGWLLLFRRIANRGGGFYCHVLRPVSEASYGMYLCHMLVLALWSAFFRERLGLGDAGVLGCWTTPVQVMLTAACTFVCVAAVSVLVRRIPKIGKSIMG